MDEDWNNLSLGVAGVVNGGGLSARLLGVEALPLLRSLELLLQTLHLLVLLLDLVFEFLDVSLLPIQRPLVELRLLEKLDQRSAELVPALVDSEIAFKDELDSELHLF